MRLPRLILRRVPIVARLRYVFLCIVLVMLAGSLLSFWHYRNVSALATNAARAERHLASALRLNNLLLALMGNLYRLAQKRSPSEFESQATRLAHEFTKRSAEPVKVLHEITEQHSEFALLARSVISVVENLPQRISSMAALARHNDWAALDSRLMNQADQTDVVLAALMQRMETDLGQARTRMLGELQRSQERAVSTLVVTALLSVGIALLLAAVVTRSVTQPLTKLSRGARSLAAGDLSHRIQDQGADELADLGSAFNQMAHEIQRLFDEVHTAREVAQSAQAEEQERARELARANQDLQQFAYSASHDLQEPLRIITLYGELLRRRWPENADPEVTRCVDVISRSSYNLQQLIADLLAFTRAGDAGRGEPGSTDVNEVFQRVVGLLRVQIESENCTIQAEPLPAVRAHDFHVQQVLQNLISNAIKYRSPDRAPVIEVGARRINGHWEFRVRDNGIGIAPEYREQIFGMFKRLHGRQYAGTGIGLAICRRIVEGYGGRIWVDSTVNESSTFYFTLPCAASDS